MVTVTRDESASEWFNVATDGIPIGHFGRTEDLGMVEWVAYSADNRRLGTFRGRGCKAQAQAAVIRLATTAGATP